MVKKYCNDIIVFLIYFLSFTLFSLFSAFTGLSNLEVLSADLCECAAANSSTSSVNLNMVNVGEEIKAPKVMEDARKCYNLNVSNLFQDKYMYRTVFDSSNETFFYFDDDDCFSTMFFATTGTHKNPKGENIDSWFELKMAFEKEPNYDFYAMTTFANLRESTIKKIVEEEGGIYSLESVEERIMAGWYLNLNFSNKGKETSYIIQINNVILEDGFDSYYYNLFGNYMTMYAYGLKDCSNYAINIDFGNSVRQTSRILQDVKTMCTSDQYKASFNSRNLIDNNKYQAERNKIIDYINGDKKYINDTINALCTICFVILAIIPILFKRIKLKIIVPSVLSFCAWYILTKYLFSLLLPSIFTSQITGVLFIVIAIVIISTLFGPRPIFSKKRCIKI